MNWTKTVPSAAILTLVFAMAGCGETKAARAMRARLGELEAQTARLQDDCRAALAARDQARRHADAARTEQTRLFKKLEEMKRISQERDELKQIVAQRTTERDSLQNQLTQFGRDLQNLAARVEQAANQTPAAPTTVVATSRIISPNEK